jgi:hypothetical protein
MSSEQDEEEKSAAREKRCRFIVTSVFAVMVSLFVCSVFIVVVDSASFTKSWTAATINITMIVVSLFNAAWAYHFIKHRGEELSSVVFVVETRRKRFLYVAGRLSRSAMRRRVRRTRLRRQSRLVQVADLSQYLFPGKSRFQVWLPIQGELEVLYREALRRHRGQVWKLAVKILFALRFVVQLISALVRVFGDRAFAILKQMRGN